MSQSFFLFNPTKVSLDKQEIIISEFDFKNKKNINQRIPFDKIQELVFVSDSSSISKGVIKNLVGKNVVFLSKGKPIAFIGWVDDSNDLFFYSKKMAELPNSIKRKLAFVFCKGVCTSRIYQVKRLLEKRKSNVLLKKNLGRMMELEGRLIHVYKADSELKGMEGNVAKLFFCCLKELLPKEIGFTERNPDNRDLFNVLLNASHGLLRAKVSRILFCVGLNSSFGFLHFQKDKKKPFLVWDFSEFWIPYVDKLCFYAVSKKIFSEKDLVNSKETNKMFLTESAWKKLHGLFDSRFDEKQVFSKAREFKDFLDGKRKRFSWTTKKVSI